MSLAAADIALNEIDVSRPERFKDDNWQPWFARLRNEAPVHFLKDSVNGPFWSVTNHALIKEVDSNHKVFSSEAKGVSIVEPYVTEEGQIQGKSFIAIDEPEHMKKRQTVSPTVAPSNLAGMESLIRERAVDILDNLPVGKTFNWVQEV
jgi:cytochrome P450